MLYRIRRYAAVPERLVAFNDFFSGYLLPIQVRHGARLVGRWETEEAEVIAVWNTTTRPPTSASTPQSGLIRTAPRRESTERLSGSYSQRGMRRSPVPPSSTRADNRSRD